MVEITTGMNILKSGISINLRYYENSIYFLY